MLRNRVKGDIIIWFIVAILAMISIVSVFSSGSYLVRKDPNVMAKVSVFLEQSRSVVMGLIALIICYNLRLSFYRKAAPVIFFASLIMVVLLLLPIPGLRTEINGAIRGLNFFGKTLQPFEFAKVGLVLYIGWALEMFDGKMETYKDFVLKVLIWVAAMCIAILPNSFSTCLLLGVVSMMMMFFMDVKWKHLLITAVIAIGAIALVFGTYNLGCATFGKDEMSKVGIFNRIGTVQSRVETFFAPDDGNIDTSTLTAKQLAKMDQEKRQSENAKIAIAEGKIFGKGPGHSTQRYFLPMPFSDFIFAIIVEEMGLVGGTLVIVLYLILLFRCIVIATRCQTVFAQSVVLGLGFLITTQAMLHIMVNVGILPVTGHTLPIVSHGGTAYIVLCGAFGIILSISKTAEKQVNTISNNQPSEGNGAEANEVELEPAVNGVIEAEDQTNENGIEI